MDNFAAGRHLSAVANNGNGRLLAFFKRAGVPEGLSVAEKYLTAAARAYREQIASTADGCLPPAPSAGTIPAYVPRPDKAHWLWNGLRALTRRRPLDGGERARITPPTVIGNPDNAHRSSFDAAEFLRGRARRGTLSSRLRGCTDRCIIGAHAAARHCVALFRQLLQLLGARARIAACETEYSPVAMTEDALEEMV
jgi:hypothetical protein